MWKKIGAFAAGALAVIGILLLANWAMKRRKATAGQVAQTTSAPGAPVKANQPTTATIAPSCGGDQIPYTMPKDVELFPGSYVDFRGYNTGCDGDVRNRNC